MIGGVDALLLLVGVVDRAEAYWAASAAITGSLIGCLILFFIARKGGEAYHRRHTASARGQKLRDWFHEYGLLTVFVPAFVPVIPMPMKVFVISAGALGSRPLSFTLVVLAARIPRYLFLAWLGARLGSDALPYLRSHLWGFVLFAVGLFVLLYLLVYLVDRRRSRRAGPTATA